MLSTIWTIIVALLVFALMIFVHELGHFMAAKSFGIRVNEFAIGMGPAIWKRQGKKTLYSIRALPVGGFCKMEGEEEKSEDPAAFNNAARWKRFIVLVAGATMNIILGLAIFVVLRAADPSVAQPVIDDFVAHTNLEAAGFQPGDRIVGLDGTSVNIYEDVNFFMQRVTDDTPITVTVEREGERISADITPVIRVQRYTYYEDKVVVEELVDGNLTSQTEVPITDPEAYRDRIGQTGEESSYMLGFVAKAGAPSFGQVLHDAFFLTLFNIKLVYVSIFELVTGQVPATQISGPIGIIGMIGTVAQVNWESLFNLVALLTVNLGVMNLLPIPALDGGQILFLAIEGILRRDIPLEKKGVISLIGFVLLFGLIIFATYNDIVRMISGWFS